MVQQKAAAEPQNGNGLTLKDRLSHLTLRQAGKLLGGEGEKLIREGGKYEVQIDGDVCLDDDLFRVNLGEATVTITLAAGARGRLRWDCSRCHGACEHVGAAFSFVLE